MTKTISTGFALGVGIGVLLCLVVFWLMIPFHNTDSSQMTKSTDEPLYWVAPMDPNFKRDKPGKSPMGMDLVPVYEKDNAQDAEGTVSIDPVTIQNLGVKTTKIEAIAPRVSIETIGYVSYAQDEVEHIHSRIEGWVETLYVSTQGDFVRKGAPLYTIYSPELVNAQEEFLIALEQDVPALVVAARARLQALAVPNTQIESLEKSRKVSQAITFYSPTNGYVNSLNIQKGFYVTPNITMLSIASLDKVWVVADVFPKDANMLTLGMPATIISDDLPGQQISTQLSYLYPELNSTTRTVQARFVVENDTANKTQYSTWLKPGMYTKVQLSADVSVDDNVDGNMGGSVDGKIIVAPTQAIIRTGKSDRVVLALGDGKYKSIEVTLGRSIDDAFEILDGLVVGDEIVTSAQFLIDSESSITSDFLRTTDIDHSPPVSMFSDSTGDEHKSAWTQATINEINVERRRVNLTHGYLDAFDMMGMTMDFTVASDIQMDAFVIGESVHVEITREESGMFQVKTLHVTSMQTPSQEHNSHKSKEGVPQ